MPFAEKFKKAMAIPKVGDTVGEFTVETVEVGHEGVGNGIYEYPVEMILSGVGGQQGLRRTLKGLFAFRRTVFSGYGNPYQLAMGRMNIESLGNRRFRLTTRGIGVRIRLEPELERFMVHLSASGLIPGSLIMTEAGETIDDYLKEYQTVARRKPEITWQ